MLPPQDMGMYPLECSFSRMEIASTAMQATISVDILHEPTKITIVRFEMQQHVYNQNWVPQRASLSAKEAQQTFSKLEEQLTPGLMSSKHPTDSAQACPWPANSKGNPEAVSTLHWIQLYKLMCHKENGQLPDDEPQAKMVQALPWHSSPLVGLWNVHGAPHDCHQVCCKSNTCLTYCTWYKTKTAGKI